LIVNSALAAQTPSVTMQVAVLGGTLSGVVAARRLSESGARVHLFRNLNDPKRNINSLHPICEYQSSTFVLRSDAPREFSEEVGHWQHSGLVEPAPNFQSVHIDAQGNVQHMEPKGRRFSPHGGFFALLDSLIEQLAGSVDVKAQQLEWMSRDKSGKWWLHRAGDNTQFGPYDVVLHAFDALPRAVRKASHKQLLESALPHSANVIASAARSPMCSSMVVVLHFDPPLQVPYDSIVFDGIPELQFASRNPKQHQAYRGIREKHDTWTVVATPAWSLLQRPGGKSNGVSWQGKWDKVKVGKTIQRAFGRALHIDVDKGRQIIPTFHWEGCSYITQVLKGAPCAFDAECGLGWCGDLFGGMGPTGAVVSGFHAAAVTMAFQTSNPKSVLPGEGDWGMRPSQPDDEDIMTITGPATGREDQPNDGLDHTWQTAVRCALGEQVVHADSYRNQRRQGAMGDRPNFRNKDGPWMAPSLQRDDRASRLDTGKLPRLRCQTIDGGILRVTGMPLQSQRALLRAVFPADARGVCGGLYDARRGTIDIGYGEKWPCSGTFQASWTDVGMHGNHTVDWEAVEGDIVNQVLASIKQCASEVLGNFSPDCVRVAYENMRGRTIRQGQTLCGWSRDRDRVDNSDGSPKICVVLGNAKIQHGYKYSKEDRESLDVELCPGDVLILHGPARTWCSAVNGFQDHAGSFPFDFAHVWFLDHRRLQKVNPDIYASIHQPSTPAPGGPEYKWMQFAYKVLGAEEGEEEVRMEVSDGCAPPESSPDAGHSQLSSARKVYLRAAPPGPGSEPSPKKSCKSSGRDAQTRRWGSKLRAWDSESFEQNGDDRSIGA